MRFFAGVGLFFGVVFCLATSLLAPVAGFAKVLENPAVSEPSSSEQFECEHMLLTRGPLESAAFEMHRRLIGKRFHITNAQGDLLSLHTFGVAHLDNSQLANITAEVTEIPARSAKASIGDYSIKLSYDARRGHENKQIIFFRMPPIARRVSMGFKTREQVDRHILNNDEFVEEIESIDSSAADYVVSLSDHTDIDSYLMSRIDPVSQVHELHLGVYLPCRDPILREFPKVQVRMNDIWLCRLPVLVLREQKDR